jgi:hypothetical protein
MAEYQFDLADDNDSSRPFKILGAIQFITGALTAVFACYPILFFILCVRLFPGFSNTLFKEIPMFPFPLLPVLLITLSWIIIIFGWMLALAIMLNGVYLFNRKWRAYCLVVCSVESLLLLPIGTVLGLISFNMLAKPEYRRLFS